ncbi:beta-1,6-N-acetylglucosaminyltransferase [Enterococcus faecium]|uniref:beta-1,6-N-acetylglucosaminyltransferase n=1 Tax=Enterococcus faecium TaxID=1352 RepID=UPI00220A2E72|nr:beta-1,6-N-acetylglucosaminyltransferase [Enterococcus faecium]BDP98148.1 hypothetical protein EfmGK961_19640 [Enterococcus faecium]
MGADYPIKDNEYIYNYFKKNSSVEFIRGIDLDQIKHKEFYYKHIDVPVLEKSLLSRDAFRVINLIICLLYFMPSTFNVTNIPMKIAKFDLYHGSQWWALSKECLTELIQMYEQNQQDYLNFKIGMFAPDEKFFHTLFF